MNTISHDLITDVWYLAYDGEGVEESLVTLEPLDDATSFTVMGIIKTMPEVGGIGLTLHGPEEPLLLFLARAQPAPPEFYAVEIAPPATPFYLRIEYHDGVAHLAFSESGLNWTNAGEIAVPIPDQVGIILSWDPHSPAVWGEVEQFRILPDLWGYTGGEVTIGLPAVIPPSPMAITTQWEPRLHALVGAQLGDLEFDVGRSVRWSQWFIDDMHISDVNTGMQRYWVINWAGLFPEVTYNVTGINFFSDPVGFRKMQFAEMLRRWPMDDTDWVLFCDAHEGLSCDTRSEPDDCTFIMFKPYLYREIARATSDRVVLPFFALIRYEFVQNLQYYSTALNSDGTPMVPVQSAGVPFYLPYLGLTRLVRVSALRDENFDWTSIDQPQPIPDPEVKLQIISYGYAHWNLQDISPGETTVPQQDEENDDGWRQRNMLSLVRPLPGLPTGTWQPLAADPMGSRGPWAPEFRNAPLMLYPPNPTPPILSFAMSGVLTPLYHTIFRLNMRDGVWYLGNTPGNTRLVWDPAAKQWIEATPDAVAAVS